jgi:FlaA1/EpsC-like NDP-sugar epimerase
MITKDKTMVVTGGVITGIGTIFHDKTLLITGGSGSWGQELTSQLLEFLPRKVIIFSRGEISQVAMQRKFSTSSYHNNSRLEFVIGDIRDAQAVDQVCSRGVDYIFHLAALKHVPICENQPAEAYKTNVIGVENLINSAIKYQVKKVLYVSTDKAVDPINAYGMTKGIGERLIIQANTRTKNTEFLCIRAGNVLGTNGSLVPHIINQIRTKNRVTLTDEKMTRYFLTLKTAIGLLFFAMEEGLGGEIYVMNMPSFYIKDLIEVLVEWYGNKFTKIDIVGKREGEKLHEVLISPYEVPRTYFVSTNYHVIYPSIFVDRTNFHMWDHLDFASGVSLKSSFTSKDSLRGKDELIVLLKEGGFLSA